MNIKEKNNIEYIENNGYLYHNKKHPLCIFAKSTFFNKDNIRKRKSFGKWLIDRRDYKFDNEEDLNNIYNKLYKLLLEMDLSKIYIYHMIDVSFRYIKKLDILYLRKKDEKEVTLKGFWGKYFEMFFIEELSIKDIIDKIKNSFPDISRSQIKTDFISSLCKIIKNNFAFLIIKGDMSYEKN